MSTSTSIRSSLLLPVGGHARLSVLRVLGRSRTAVREELAEPARDRLRHELVHLAAERGDLLDAARGDEADLRARHHVDRLDLRRERPVQLIHLELPLE